MWQPGQKDTRDVLRYIVSRFSAYKRIVKDYTGEEEPDTGFHGGREDGQETGERGEGLTRGGVSSYFMGNKAKRPPWLELSVGGKKEKDKAGGGESYVSTLTVRQKTVRPHYIKNRETNCCI